MERAAFLAHLTEAEAATLWYDWRAWARPKQIAPPGDWTTWLVLAGRGFGKTRVGAEWVRWRVETGQARRIALVGQTKADVRDVMLEGESGLLTISPPWFRPKYYPSKRKLVWPNGAVALTFSADEPDQLRGPQQDTAWGDELAKWKYPEAAWSNLMFGLRLGNAPQCCATGTPSPTKLIRELVEDPTVSITRGSTYENQGNLAAAFIKQVIRKYEGTRLGRQELLAEILTDTPGALWRREAMIEAYRWTRLDAEHKLIQPILRRIVVAIDPAVSSNEGSAETGIIVAGQGLDGHGYILEDLSLRASPHEWAKVAIDAYYRWKADRIIAETNNGGEMVESTIRAVDPNVSYRAVHASRGKQTRAEPVSAKYELGEVHHVGTFAALEDQYCSWVTGETSPDHLDAAVWALTELLLDESNTKGWSAQIRADLEARKAREAVKAAGLVLPSE